MIESPLALATTIAAATALAFWLDYRFPALGKVGASMMAIIFGAILSNTGPKMIGGFPGGRGGNRTGRRHPRQGRPTTRERPQPTPSATPATPTSRGRDSRP